MVAVTGVAPAFTPVKDAMFPVPLAASPIEGVSLVQLNVVPPTVPENITPAVPDPLHTVWSDGSVTFGVGLTVMVKVCADPVHTGPAVDGVTVMVATTGVVPAFTAAKAPMLPVPAAAKPIEGVSLVQLK